MKVLRMLVLAVAVCAVAGSAKASELFIPTGAASHVHVAQMGMGGLTTTVATNAHTPFYNPAMLSRQSTAVEISIPVGTGTDIFDFVEFVKDNQERFKNFDNLTTEEQSAFIKDSQKWDNKWIGLELSPYFGVAAHNFGFGVYALTHSGVKVDQGVFSPAVGIRAYGDIVAGLAYGFRPTIVGRLIEMGVGVRYINRRVVAPMRIDAADAGSADDLGRKILDELQDSKSGFGVDVGAVRTFELIGQSMDVGVVMQDLVGSLDGYVKPNLKAGAMYHVPFAKGLLLRRWDLGIEANDLFNREGVGFAQKVNLGTELAILGGFLKLRGGFHQGYPTYGLGLSLKVLKIDGAKFTRELSNRAGGDPDELYMASLTIGW